MDSIVKMLQAVVDAINHHGGKITIQKLLDQLVDYAEGLDMPEPVGPPQVFVVNTGEKTFDLCVRGVSGKITSFQSYGADFDPDGDGDPARIISVQPGDDLAVAGWAFGYRSDIGRIGAYTSRLGAVDADMGTVLCTVELEDNEAISLTGIAVSGIEEDEDGTIHSVNFLRDESLVREPSADE